MHTALPWILFAIGVFYAAGGIVLARSIAMDRLLDKAIAAITLKRDHAEETSTRILTLGAGLTLASGLSLLAQSRAALPVFVLNILVQAGYLIWAGRAQPPENELERRGRQATTNALFIYIGVFGLVLMVEQQGLWRTWLGAGMAGLAAELLVTALLTVACMWLIANPPGGQRKDGKSDPEFLWDDADECAGRDPSRPTEFLRLSPEYHCWPTWDDETCANVDPAGLGFSKALIGKLTAWDERFQKCYNPDDPFNSRFSSVEEERLWADEGGAVWEGICKEWTGEAVNKISHVPYLMGDAFDGVNAYALPPEERVGKMAARCSVIEIRDILGRLDTLAADRAALEDWDGDTQDDIARMQKFYAMVLSRVDARYRADVEAGLESGEDETRAWVRLALDGQAG
ncbi:hypothetical protein [Hyphomonas sp.]|uniref:hypothetical protein n=1 Tax=Hyphomonas sp. TaxID=87 RepID=UPI001BCAED9D|nr:hypothetical protein [Hyphomonas sp.]